MLDTSYEMKSRIFKRERLKATNNSVSLVNKNYSSALVNQLELSWINEMLEESYVKVVCRVTLKEWERVLKDYPVQKAFFQFQKPGRVQFLITFKVGQDLSTADIKRVVLKATEILTACLNKVSEKLEVSNTKKVVESVKQPQETTPSNRKKRVRRTSSSSDTLKTPGEKSSVVIEGNTGEQLSQLRQQNRMYRTQIIELQEREFAYLKESDKETNGWKEKYQQAIDGQYKQQEQLRDTQKRVKSQLASIETLNQELAKERQARETLALNNQQLTQKLKDSVISARRVEKATDLEKKLKLLEAERLDDKQTISELERNVERLERHQKELEKSLEQSDTTKSDLLEQARIDYDDLEDVLSKKEQALIVANNNYQKSLLEKDIFKEKADEQADIIIQQERDIRRLEESVELKIQANDTMKSERESYDIQIAALHEEIEEWQGKYERLTEQQVVRETEMLLKNKHMDDRYEELEQRYYDLEQEGEGYRQKLSLLVSQSQQMKNQLGQVEAETDKLLREVPVEVTNDLSGQKLAVERPTSQKVVKEKVAPEQSNEHQDSMYEEDPFIEDVAVEAFSKAMTKDQSKDEEHIRYLFDLADQEEFTEIKVNDDDYKKYRIELKFLNFRWNQIFNIDNIEKNIEFLEWCQPQIDEIEEFTADLSDLVKRPMFSKKQVIIDSPMWTKLKAYSALSVYLDTYYLKVSTYIDKYFLNEETK